MAVIKLRNRATKLIYEVDESVYNANKANYTNTYDVLRQEKPKDKEEVKEEKKTDKK